LAQVEAVLFDAYGTLFDTRSAVDCVATRLDGKADRIAQLWRQKQLEYTWTLSLRGLYTGFDVLVRDALRYALAAEGIDDPRLAEEMMAGFGRLTPLADAASTVQELKRRGLRCGILSNGTAAMLGTLLEGHGFAQDIDPVLSVDAAGIFKPDARVYRLGVDALRLKPRQIGFVSGNAWDAAGAAGFGFRSVWINWAAQPAEYGLDRDVAVVSRLGDVPGVLS
jgi:2-haloacid dehalogenase